jgi:hypothetical protein
VFIRNLSWWFFSSKLIWEDDSYCDLKLTGTQGSRVAGSSDPKDALRTSLGGERLSACEVESLEKADGTHNETLGSRPCRLC